MVISTVHDKRNIYKQDKIGILFFKICFGTFLPSFERGSEDVGSIEGVSHTAKIPSRIWTWDTAVLQHVL